MLMRKVNWIYMVKGIACILIFIVHYAAGINRNIFGLESVFSMRPFRFLTAGSFAICIFLQVSAFLICERIMRTDDLREVGKMCIRRYLRLFFPVLIASLFAYVLQETAGFHNIELGNMLENEWIKSYYTEPLELGKVFYASLYKVLWQGNYEFDPPLWMLTTLFKGSYLAIIISLIVKYLKKWHGRLIVFLLLFVIYFMQNSMYISVVMGVAWSCISGTALFSRIKDSKMHKPLKCAAITIVAAVLTSLLGYCEEANKYLSIYLKESSYIIHERLFFWCTLLVFLILICLDMVFAWTGDLNADNPFVKLGGISMGVYLFHWPILCSFMSIVYIKYVFPQNSGIRIGLHFLTSLTVVILVSYVYGRYVERYIDKLIKMV